MSPAKVHDEVTLSSKAADEDNSLRQRPNKTPVDIPPDKKPEPMNDIVAREIMALQPHIHPPVPNPAPLGLIAFGFTTALLQIRHTRIGGDTTEELQQVDNMMLGFAMFFGGLLQIIAGVSEIKRNNIFGYTAFCLYGGFWMSLGTVEIISMLSTKSFVVNPKASQAVLAMTSIFTYMLWSLTFKLNKTICSLFFLLGTTCLLLSIGVEHEEVDKVGGYFGIATSVNAWWLAYVELYNDVYGHGLEIIPLGHFRTKDVANDSRKKKKSVGVAHIPGRIHGTRPTVVMPSNGPDVEQGVFLA